ncbi:MAG: type IX secretion system membrane protein PorP/SprF [Candidatus Margulisiibacteriota bacterium]
MKFYLNKLNISSSLSVIVIAIFTLSNITMGANYLMLTDLGSSAEMIRRGNIEGFSAGSNGVFENPAGLYRVNKLSTSVFSSELMNEVNYRNISVAFKSDIGVIAIGYMDAGVDDIISTRLQGEGDNATVIANGTFSYKNRVMKVGYQTSITDQLHLGVNGVGYFNEISTYSGTGYNIDAGLIYLFSELEVSLLVRNLIPMKVDYTDSSDSNYSGEEDLPLQMVLSAAYPFGDLDIMGQFKYDGTNTLMGAGVEYTPSFLYEMLTISAGYKEYSALDQISNTVTFGAGLNLFGLSLDYAYEQSDHFEYDSNNFASVGFDF